MTPEESSPKFLTAEDAAEYIGIHVQTIWKWRREGYGPAYLQLSERKRRPMVRYRREDLDAFLQSRIRNA